MSSPDVLEEARIRIAEEERYLESIPQWQTRRRADADATIRMLRGNLEACEAARAVSEVRTNA